MSQEYLNNIRSQIGMGMQDVRNADQRSKDQKYTYSGNPNMPYNYSYDQNMGGQNPSLGRYRPPMMDANGGWQDSGGYAYNLPTNSGPYRGSFGQGFGPPMPQFNGFGSGSVGNMYDQYGRGNYIRGGNGQPVAGMMDQRGPQYGQPMPMRGGAMGPQMQQIQGGMQKGAPPMLANMGQYNPLGSQIGPEAFQVNPQAFQATQQLLQQIFARSKPGMPAGNNFNPTNGTQAPPVDSTNPYQNYNLPPTFRYY